ncbi:MAG TPA: DUF503 domain-containing protein [Candidatus Latescibacteria bacterium]|nr:DUF503 domain-containing protein [Candidatus Latescibacterota bacterium]
MLVGTCEIQLWFPGSRSLKEKRFAMKSLKDRIRARFNVSVAEVDGHGLWQRGALGVAMASTETDHIHRVLSEVVRFVEGDGRVEVLDYRMEVI